MRLFHSLASLIPFVQLVAAQGAVFSSLAAVASALPAATKWPKDLVGTWSTKSLSTLTGPDFYDPIADKLIEPEHTGISYSFTSDGHYEEAYYRAISAPSNPQCPQGLLQWQHGNYVVNASGSIYMMPIMVDGRQLISDPCTSDNALYLRYNQSELMASYEALTDPYHNVPRLNLFEFNGSPMNPMYLVYHPPQMLPTTTLNPTHSGTPTVKATSKPRKRSLDVDVLPSSWKKKLVDNKQAVRSINADRLWWVAVGMTGIGGTLYLVPKRLGFVS